MDYRGGLLEGLSADELATIRARFLAKVQPAPGSSCLLWTGYVRPQGYGAFAVRLPSRGIRPYGAHRISWELFRGPIPEGLNACHNCPTGDDRRCVNPQHLFLGTHADNINDARSKGRLDNSRTRTRKLSLAARLEIFFAPRTRNTGIALARKYGVSKTCIALTRQGRFVGAPPQFEAVPARQVVVVGDVRG